jgi:hypothetical protein
MPHSETLIRCSEASGAQAKSRQRAKIQQIRTALELSGYVSLDQQADALGLGRSTTWSMLRGKHKSSGISAAIILRMLSTPHLPPAVRTKLVEYVEEKAAGHYGDKPFRVRQFMARLAPGRGSLVSTVGLKDVASHRRRSLKGDFEKGERRALDKTAHRRSKICAGIKSTF